MISPRLLSTAVVALMSPLGSAVAPATAGTAKSYGTTTLEIGARKIALGVYDGTLTGARPMLTHKRSLTLRGRRLTSIRAVLGAQRTTVTALLEGKRTTIFTGPVAAIDETTRTVTLPSGVLRWAQAGARALHVSPEAAGRIAIEATLPIPEPPVLARPASAVDVTAATITWHVRDSFIRYIATGEGTKASRGAVAGTPTVSAEAGRPLVYDYSFPLKTGWYDPTSGRAWLSFAGTVTFTYTAHGIDLDANDPEIEINGSRSRAIFRFTGRRDTDPGNRRGVMEALDLSKAQITASGATRSWANIPGTIPQEAVGSIFAGFYLAGDPFGQVSVSLTAASP
ncbi:MAG TPA: HtaA domain-containing protein [Jatrophihabitans sp.]|nr:HtaA domain-containing protein [Jatrophihabitans sp.]